MFQSFKRLSYPCVIVETIRKPGVEPRKRLAINTDKLPVTPATKPAINAIACIHLEVVGTSESWWRCSLGKAQDSKYHRPGLCTWWVHSIRITQWLNFGKIGHFSREINGYLLISCICVAISVCFLIVLNREINSNSTRTSWSRFWAYMKKRK